MKKNVRDIDVKDRRVLARMDFNVPLQNGRVTDDSRLRAALPTIHYLREQGARLILCSHLGRPGGKPDDSLTLQPVAKRLGELLETEIKKLDDCVGPSVVNTVETLCPGDVLLLENTRFHAEEEQNDESFAAQLAEPAELFVNDAFASVHRSHASTEGVAHHLPAVAGLLMHQELTTLDELRHHPQRPFAAIFGGAKAEDKISLVEKLLDHLDLVVVGGVIASTLLAADGLSVGDSNIDDQALEKARELLQQQGEKLLLPKDVIIAEEESPDCPHKIVAVDRIPAGWRILDVGPDTVNFYLGQLADMRTIVWNGPLGRFEIPPFNEGTEVMAIGLVELATTKVVGGGETAAALKAAGTVQDFDHVSTGGGAFLAYLENQELPPIRALQDREQ